jgi:hypothetical protein
MPVQPPMLMTLSPDCHTWRMSAKLDIHPDLTPGCRSSRKDSIFSALVSRHAPPLFPARLRRSPHGRRRRHACLHALRTARGPRAAAQAVPGPPPCGRAASSQLRLIRHGRGTLRRVRSAFARAGGAPRSDNLHLPGLWLVKRPVAGTVARKEATCGAVAAHSAGRQCPSAPGLARSSSRGRSQVAPLANTPGGLSLRAPSLAG